MRRPTNAALIAELRRTANFETANFDKIHEGDVIIPKGKVTEFIRERTRLYRDSWTNPVINDIEQRLVKEPRK